MGARVALAEQLREFHAEDCNQWFIDAGEVADGMLRKSVTPTSSRAVDKAPNVVEVIRQSLPVAIVRKV